MPLFFLRSTDTAGRPKLHGELAVRAVLRAGGVLYFGPTPEASIEVSTEQAFEALEKGLDKLVWTLGPSTTERPAMRPSLVPKASSSKP